MIFVIYNTQQKESNLEMNKNMDFSTYFEMLEYVLSDVKGREIVCILTNQ